jgi:hypothetical protein
MPLGQSQGKEAKLGRFGADTAYVMGTAPGRDRLSAIGFDLIIALACSLCRGLFRMGEGGETERVRLLGWVESTQSDRGVG